MAATSTQGAPLTLDRSQEAKTPQEAPLRDHKLSVALYCIDQAASHALITLKSCLKPGWIGWPVAILHQFEPVLAESNPHC